MGKYDPLRKYLAGRFSDEVRMTFSDIEELVGPLPVSARIHRAWWGNNGSNVEARAWLEAGWRVRTLDQVAERVTFARAAVGASRTTQSAAMQPSPSHHALPHTRDTASASSLQETGHRDRLPDGSSFAGRYRVECRLGEGERKQTYLAWDMKQNRRVALAIVSASVDPGGTEHEVRILGQAGPHPYMVTLYESSLEPPPQYLVFEYLPRGELGDFCQNLHARGEQMPLPEFFRLARQLARVLAHIHERGIIHRDVSASNIWLDDRGNAHLGDFDTAISESEPLPDTTVTTTEGFAAPELQSGADLDERADLYSLGAVLYQALVGIPPAVTSDQPTAITPPSRLRDDLPAGLDRLILSMLATQREERPRTAAAVLQALRDIEKRAADLESLLTHGESNSVEFKSSLRTDVPGGVVNKALERVVVKTVAGFLNGHGGTLLIGIADDGTPIGLEGDYRSSDKIAGRDGFERKLRELVSNALGAATQAFIIVTFHRVNGQDVCRVAVEPSDRPVYVREDGKVKFLLRTGNATNELTVDEAIKYYTTRWD